MKKKTINILIILILSILLLYFSVPQTVGLWGYDVAKMIIKEVQYRKMMRKYGEKELEQIRHVNKILEANSNSKNKDNTNITDKKIYLRHHLIIS